MSHNEADHTRSSGDAGSDPAPAPAVLGLSMADRIVLLTALPLLGAGVGYGIPWVADLAADLPWAPFQGPLRLVAALDGFWALVGGLAVGAIGGGALAVYAVHRAMRVTVAADALTVTQGDHTRTISPDDVSAVFYDRKELVVLDQDTRELVRDELEGKRAEVAEAFRARGYPWCDGDPHADAFRRWVPDTPDLPGTVDALLKAREKALANGSDRDAAEYRAEVQKLGYVVRTDGTRQYWRPLAP